MKNLFRGLFNRSATAPATTRVRKTNRRPVLGCLEELEGRLLLHGSPSLAPLSNITMPAGQTFHMPLDGSHTNSHAITYTATSSNSSITLSVPTGNPSVRISTTINGVAQEDIIVQLTKDLTPRTVEAITALINSGFFNGRIFHRIIPDFVAQFGEDQRFAFTASAATDTFTAAGHDFTNGDRVQFTANGGALPGGVTAGTTFFVRDVTGNTFKLARTDTGDAIDLTSDGSGRVQEDFPNNLTALLDEFDRRLTFNGFGQFAMAKQPADDSGTAQIFITDVDLTISNSGKLPPRHLNFDHTIFGQLTQGIQAMTNIIAAGSSSGTPSSDVIITSMTVFDDTENGVLRISAPDNFTGSSTITVTAADSDGVKTERQFTVNVVADTVNDKAFLGNLPPQATTIGRPVSFVIPFVDLEANDPHTFAVGSPTNFMNGNNLVNQPANATVTLDQATGRLTVTPNAGFTGTIELKIGVRDGSATTGPHGTDAAAFDTNVISIAVAANQAPIANDLTITAFTNTNNLITLTGEDGDAVANQTLTFRVTTLPANGVLETQAGVAVTVDTDLASPILRYRPNAGFTGADTFTYTVRDNGGTDGGGVDVDATPATVSITVAVPTPNPFIELKNSTLFVRGGAEANRLDVSLNAAGDSLVVTKDTQPGQIFPLASVRQIVVRGGEGDDTITIDEDIEISASIFGDEGDDTITSGAGDDYIRGGDGDDDIDGGDGDDAIRGGDGDDIIAGGDGNDIIRGQDGDDEIDGDDGDDILLGGFGDDELNGGDGNDKLMGDPRPNLFDPNFDPTLFGDDVLNGDEGDDYLFGSLGDDELDGGDGDDRLRGSLGIDMLLGSLGLDKLSGGRGVDEYNMRDDDELDDIMTDVKRRVEIVQHNFDDAGLLGVRTFELPGAPSVTNAIHDNNLTDSFYVDNGYTNPPTYGPHRASGPSADHPQGAPVQQTGVFTIPLADVDLVHNLEHGHVWISYDPAHVPAEDIARLEALVRSFGNNGSGAGILLTPRAANDDATPIALASWGHLQKLAAYDRAAVLAFIKTNRGHGPEGFITP